MEKNFDLPLDAYGEIDWKKITGKNITEKNILVTQRQLDEAFKYWCWRFSDQTVADRMIASLGQPQRGLYFSEQEAEVFRQAINKMGWLKIARTAMNLSGNEVSFRKGVSRWGYYKAEKREVSGQITLAKIKDFAAAIDCDFVYYVRPRNKRTFAQAVWGQLVSEVLPTMLDNSTALLLSPHKKCQRVAACVQSETKKPKIRRDLHWTERKNAKVLKD